jgi:MSHA pilin protein MshD
MPTADQRQTLLGTSLLGVPLHDGQCKPAEYKPAALQSVARPRLQSGLSLIEMVVFIVIVGIAVAGVLAVIIQTSKASADPQLRMQALAIAEGLLEEIELSHFTFCDPSDASAETATGAFITGSPGNVGAGCTKMVEDAHPETGNARPFDNVNDYVEKFGEEYQLKPINYDIGNGTVGDLMPFSAFVTIVPEALGSGTGLIGSDASGRNTEVLRIRVRVHYGSEDIVLDGYRTRYAPNFLP